MTPQELELTRRTAHLRPYLEASLTFSRRTSWLLPKILHTAPLEFVIWLFKRHARDMGL